MNHAKILKPQALGAESVRGRSWLPKLDVPCSLLSVYGTVTGTEVITGRMTGRNKWFGFAEMGPDQDAQAAIAALNGQDHVGRTIVVNEAKPLGPRGDGSGGYGRGRDRHWILRVGRQQAEPPPDAQGSRLAVR